MPKRVDKVICERQVKGWDTLPTYVSVVKFNVPDVGIRFEIKHNKDDEYEPFDNIKKGLLKVVKEWQDKWGVLKENIGRYEFVNLILELYTQALVECEGDAFKVEYYEARDQIGKYVDTNKKRIETLNRIKEENKELDKNIKEEKYMINEKEKELEKIRETIATTPIEKDVDEIVEEEEKKPKKTRTKKKKEEKVDKKVVKPLDILPTSSRRSWMTF